MPSLKDYLTSKYGSEPPKKKKKKANAAESSTVQVETDDPAVPEPEAADPDDSDEEAVPEPDTNKKQTGWKKLGTGDVVKREELETGRVKSEPAAGNEPTMSSGARAGLQTAEQVQKSVAEKRRVELERLEASETSGRGAETVHRDASGRIIDIEEFRRQEQEQKEKEERDKVRRHKEINQGLVQRLEAEKQRRELKDSSRSSLNVSKDDRELNDSLRERDREFDPAAPFVSKKKRKAAIAVSATGLPVYTGPFAANRFGIVPGCKWDGVDRSNGFERKWFEKQTERQQKKTLAYTVATDD